MRKFCIDFIPFKMSYRIHIRRCMLCEFKMDSSPTEAAGNIRFVYGNEALIVQKNQRLFAQFQSVSSVNADLL